MSFKKRARKRFSSHYKRRILKSNVRPDISKLILKDVEKKALMEVVRDNPLQFPGLTRGDPRLSRAVSGLRGKGLVVREGYRYYPTKDAYLMLEKIRKKPPSLLDFFNKKPEFTAPWSQVFKIEGLTKKPKKKYRLAPGRYSINWATGERKKLPRRKCQHIPGHICTIRQCMPGIAAECHRLHGRQFVTLNNRKVRKKR